MTKTTFLTGADIAATLTDLFESSERVLMAVAWGTVNSVLPALMKNRSKVVKLVVGTHFYQTHPAFLQQVRELEGVRVMGAGGHSTFHPKIYLFLAHGSARVVIGSANFTHGGMAKNVEACTLIETTSDDAVISKLRQFVETAWSAGHTIDDDFLRDYAIQYTATKAARNALEKFIHFRKPKPAAQKGDPLTMDWEGFIAEVRRDRHHSVEGRLKVLKQARQLLDGAGSFAALGEMERKCVAGVLGPREREAFDVDWAWFGSMFGTGVFKNRIKDNHAALSKALDAIPASGVVARQHYEQFALHFQSAFDDGGRRAGIAPASRLLAMKRPDYFVCYDTANRKGLSEHFGFAMSTLSWETYWDDLIEPLLYSAWWCAPRPSGQEGEVWDNRAAFLDAIFYAP